MNKRVKGIFINTTNRQISEVEIELTLDNYYKLLNVEMIEMCCSGLLSSNSFIYVDEEGYCKSNNQFTINGSNQPYVGNGILLCLNDDGEDIDIDISLEYAKQNIKFI